MFVIIGILLCVIAYQQIKIRYWRNGWMIAIDAYDHALEDFDLAAASLYDITGIDIRN